VPGISSFTLVMPAMLSHPATGHTVPMRQPFAHEAILDLAPDADAQAPGAAITTALCGHWEHAPPCPLAPHHTHADRVGDQVRLRILFAAEPTLEGDIRERIDRALAGGQLRGPDGDTSRWQLTSSGRSDVTPEEAAHAGRLASTPSP
jgi:hypothetical protein